MKQRTQQKGQAVVELTMTLVMFVVMVALICTVCVYLYLQFSVISAAREGARLAAVFPNLPTGSTAGITAIKAKAKDFFLQTTGQTLQDDDISITLPSGTYGYRNVSVTVTHKMENPLPIAPFLASLGGGDTSALDNIPLSATASMRYEE